MGVAQDEFFFLPVEWVRAIASALSLLTPPSSSLLLPRFCQWVDVFCLILFFFFLSSRG